ncbi:2-oxoglutarate (2OG) and Fe(II)-dependent oxygenase superfamily protein, partial [Striga asiatica]
YSLFVAISSETFLKRKSLITRTSRGVQFFTVVTIDMAPEPPQLAIGSTYCYGRAEKVPEGLFHFSSWCGECQREKRERQRQSVAATKLLPNPNNPNPKSARRSTQRQKSENPNPTKPDSENLGFTNRATKSKWCLHYRKQSKEKSDIRVYLGEG